ncbi:MAG: UDP-N-acetylmuramate--L-alanine ligase [Candidatus Brocadiia bacterium]
MSREQGVHLVGVAGAGMSPLAQALLAAGRRVSGSDRYLDQGRQLEVLDKLRRAGVRLAAQDGSGVRPDTAAVVVSTAIEPDNPDLAAAARLGVPVVHRARMLARLLEGTECIAVTGTSGKTTVTGLMGHLLAQLGEEPTVVNGGIVRDWESERAVGNFRAGRSTRWVVEADESDRSLLHYRPQWAIVTNVSADHFALEETRELFRRFIARVQRGVVGPLADSDAGRAFRPRLSARGARFVYRGQAFRVPLLGRHNAENALQAVLLCERLGHPLDAVAAALRSFGGIRRRLEVAGSANGVTVIDDYAHNPAKIRAAWQAVAPHYRRVLAVWRPHGFGPLAAMFDRLARLFAQVAAAGCPRLYLLPVYYAGGTATATVTSQALARRLADDGAPAELVPDADRLVARLCEEARPGDAVLSMGARDPDLPALARRIVEAMEQRG